MVDSIYDPLDDYVKVFRDKFRSVCTSTFDQLATEAGIDLEANRRTCTTIQETQRTISKLNQRHALWIIPCVLLWIIFAIGVAIAILSFVYEKLTIGIGASVCCVLLLLLLLCKIHPALRAIKAKGKSMEAHCAQLVQHAWEQMEPLNRLFDWEIFTRMMSQTVPKLEFDPFFTTQRLEDLKVIYGWNEAFNTERSVLYSHSGLINGNPFVLCRTKKMEWGARQYTGELTIHWTESVRDSDGKYRTVHRSQTLTATISRPYPEYYKKTRLIYGNTAAPDLTFHRTPNGYMSKSKWRRKSMRKVLKRKARDLDHGDFAMLNNEEFEAAFDTSNRNNNHQFALLFTPLAQINIMNLLGDTEVGYGDDFDFEKAQMINVITAKHMQSEEMDMNPSQYQDYSFDSAKAKFEQINSAHFRAIYFAFAPLLSVPAYQQIRSHESIYGRDMRRESAFWEHEALANYWGVDRFMHPDCVTDCILKTEKKGTSSSDTSDATIEVRAYGYRAEPRVTYVSKLGGDGYFHDVPVHWYEYLPVTGVGNIEIKEESDQSQDTYSTQTQRIERIRSYLSQSGHNLYRRSIYSRLY